MQVQGESQLILSLTVNLYLLFIIKVHLTTVIYQPETKSIFNKSYVKYFMIQFNYLSNH